VCRPMKLASLGCSRMPNGWTVGGGGDDAEGKAGAVVLLGYLDCLGPGELMNDAAARGVAEMFAGDDSTSWVFQATGAIVGPIETLCARLFDGCEKTPLLASVRRATWAYLRNRARRDAVPGWEFLTFA